MSTIRIRVLRVLGQVVDPQSVDLLFADPHNELQVGWNGVKVWARIRSSPLPPLRSPPLPSPLDVPFVALRASDLTMLTVFGTSRV